MSNIWLDKKADLDYLGRIEELKKCHSDFNYFAKNYLTIYHPIKGIIPFELYDFQSRLIESCNTQRFVISTKFRDGGFSTTTILWGLWRCLFNLDQRILVGCERDSSACRWQEVMEETLNRLPEWMRPKLKRCNRHCIEFASGSCLYFSTLEPARGKLLDALIIDEAAFHKKIERNWRALWPCLSCGGRCIVVSTTNGVGNWFEQTYHEAMEKRNNFYVFRAEYTEHPRYQDAEYCQQLREGLGEAGWNQEVLQNFISTSF